MKYFLPGKYLRTVVIVSLLHTGCIVNEHFRSKQISAGIINQCFIKPASFWWKVLVRRCSSQHQYHSHAKKFLQGCIQKFV